MHALGCGRTSNEGIFFLASHVLVSHMRRERRHWGPGRIQPFSLRKSAKQNRYKAMKHNSLIIEQAINRAYTHDVRECVHRSWLSMGSDPRWHHESVWTFNDGTEVNVRGHGRGAARLRGTRGDT